MSGLTRREGSRKRCRLECYSTVHGDVFNAFTFKHVLLHSRV